MRKLSIPPPLPPSFPLPLLPSPPPSLPPPYFVVIPKGVEPRVRLHPPQSGGSVHDQHGWSSTLLRLSVAGGILPPR